MARHLLIIITTLMAIPLLGSGQFSASSTESIGDGSVPSPVASHSPLPVAPVFAPSRLHFNHQARSPGGRPNLCGSLPWERFRFWNHPPVSNSTGIPGAPRNGNGKTPICRMGRWCATQDEAESELRRLLSLGWSGAVRESGSIWQVDVVRYASRHTASSDEQKK